MNICIAARQSAASGSGFYRIVSSARWLVLALTLGLIAAPQVAQAQIHSGTPTASIGHIKLEWVGSPPEDIARSAQAIASRLDGLATPEIFSGTMSRLLETLIAAGYRRARIAPRDFSLHGESLGCILHIAPGPRAYVSAQEFTGLVRTDTTWLRKLTGMPLGVPLTAAWINKARQRLQSVSCIRLTQTPEIIPASINATDSESVVVRWRLTESRPVRFDGLIAAGGESAGGLSGRASVQMAGLLRRDRSIYVNYQRLNPSSTQLSARFAEAAAFSYPLDWGLSLDESHQNDHRQGMALDLRYGIGRAARWAIEGEGRWRKVTPGASAVAPSRTLELSLGISHHTRHINDDEALDIPSHQSLIVTFSRRREFASPARSNPETTARRMLLKWEMNQKLAGNSVLSLQLSAAGHNWLAGADRLGPGDEWYLGGADRLRGYSDRGIAAASGAWAALDIKRRLGASAAVSVFTEGALLRDLNADGENSRRRTPYGYGCALWLISQDRIGRLEFAWRDHAAWRDGLIRLRISQNW